MPDEAPTFTPRCIQLRCKSMLVYGEAFEQDPEYQADGSDFWCVHTARNLGPDGGEVNMPYCSDPQRPCYRAF